MDAHFWAGKKVLITGHTGFKGSWLSLWLQDLKADVVGLSLDPPTTPSLYEQAGVADGMISLRGDIRDLGIVDAVFSEHEPEIVLHLAAQPLVRYSYRDPVETYATNVMGSLHILEAARSCESVRSVVMVTTDKCYENREWEWGYRENEPMGGNDPYSSSKACAELLIASYRNSYFPSADYSSHGTAIASARAGNVIGGGDWAEDRLVSDAIRAFQNNEAVLIRNPDAIRPWQHVLEPLSGYMALAEMLYVDGMRWAESWNFGPHEDDAKPVEWIVKRMCDVWGEGAAWRLDNGEHPHEANYLRLDCAKARTKLHWQPRWDLGRALNLTVNWYRESSNGADAKGLCRKEISEYTNTNE